MSRRVMRAGSWRRGAFLVAVALTTAGCRRAPLCPEVAFDADVAVPATSTTTKFLVERFSAQTDGASAGITVAIADNQGTISFEGRGPLPAFVYVREPFPAAASTLYAGLAVADGAWFPFWLYCDDGGRLTSFYGEMTDRALAVFAPVDGTCAPTADWREMPVDVRAQQLHRVMLACGFSATGAAGTDRLELRSGEPGRLELGGTSALVLPFHTVDCRSGCGPNGWFEVHSIVWDSEASTAGFTVFYLDGAGVHASGGIVFPSGRSLDASFPGAAWTVDE